MERNGSRYLVIMVVTMIMFSVCKVQAESAECNSKCDEKCGHSEVGGICNIVCIKNCEIPAASEAVYNCNLDCATSLCSSFLSDAEALEGCVDSCSMSCDNS